MLLGADPWEPQEHNLPRNHGAALQQAQQAQMQCEATIRNTNCSEPRPALQQAQQVQMQCEATIRNTNCPGTTVLPCSRHSRRRCSVRPPSATRLIMSEEAKPC